MECNKDEAVRAKGIAEGKMRVNDFEGARKIALKAQNLYPKLENISQILSICDVHFSAQKSKLGNENDWYKILQVEMTADEITIKKQFRRLALALHPDKNRFPGADSAFQLISAAHDVLSDSTKRSTYDRNWARLQSQPSQPANNRAQAFRFGAQNNGFSSINQSQTQALAVFWTVCSHCSTRYQYHREHLNKILRCIKCQKVFTASEVSGQAATPGSNQRRPQGATVGSNQGHPQGASHVPSKPKPELGKHAAFQKLEKEKVVLNQVNRRMGDKGSSASHAAGLGGFAARKTSQTENPNAKSENSNGVGMNRKSENPKPKSRKRSRKVVVESSESLDASTDSDLEDVSTEESFGVDVNPGPSHSRDQQKSFRKRRNISHNEKDDHLATPFKKQKASECTKDNGEGQQGAFNGEDSDKAGDAIEIKSDSDVDSENDGRCDLPNPDFTNFDVLRDVNLFKVGQFWACYDTVDGMPRFYAKVKKARANPFAVSFTWLEAVPIDEAFEDWVDKELPVGCGSFKLGKADNTDVVETFSHQVECVKGSSIIGGKKRGSLIFHPKIGEIWAVFKDWNLGWSLDKENDRKYQYEVVETVTDIVPGFGIRVQYLNKVKGFECLYQRSEKQSVIVPNELYKFSHYVPFVKMNGSEKEGVPPGSFELDPAALPVNPADLFYPNKAMFEIKNAVPEVDSSSQQHTIKGKSVISESKVTTRKQPVNLDSTDDETMKPRRSPRGVKSTKN